MKRMKIPGWGQCASVRGGHGDVPAHSSPSRARWLGMRMLVLTVLLSMMGAHGAWAADLVTFIAQDVNSSGATLNGGYTVEWSNFKSSTSDNQATVGSKTYYKLTNDKGYVRITAPSGSNFKAEDAVIIDCYRNGGAVSKTFTVNGVDVVGRVETNSATELRISLKANSNTIEIKRNNSGNTPFIYSIRVERNDDPMFGTISTAGNSGIGQWDGQTGIDGNNDAVRHNSSGTLYVLADGSHQISKDWRGFKFLNETGNSGYLAIKTQGKGYVEVMTRGKGKVSTTSYQDVAGTYVLHSTGAGFSNDWNVYSIQINKSDLRVGDELQVDVPLGNATDGSMNAYIKFLQVNSSGTVVDIDGFTTIGGRDGIHFNYYGLKSHINNDKTAFTITQDVYNKIGQKLVVAFKNCGITKVQVNGTRNVPVTTETDAQYSAVSIQDNSNSFNTYYRKQVTDTDKKHVRVFNSDADANTARVVYIGATAGMTIDYVRWVPMPTIKVKGSPDFDDMPKSGSITFVTSTPVDFAGKAVYLKKASDNSTVATINGGNVTRGEWYEDGHNVFRTDVTVNYSNLDYNTEYYLELGEDMVSDGSTGAADNMYSSTAKKNVCIPSGTRIAEFKTMLDPTVLNTITGRKKWVPTNQDFGDYGADFSTATIINGYLQIDAASNRHIKVIGEDKEGAGNLYLKDPTKWQDIKIKVSGPGQLIVKGNTDAGTNTDRAYLHFSVNDKFYYSSGHKWVDLDNHEYCWDDGYVSQEATVETVASSIFGYNVNGGGKTSINLGKGNNEKFVLTGESGKGLFEYRGTEEATLYLFAVNLSEWTITELEWIPALPDLTPFTKTASGNKYTVTWDGADFYNGAARYFTDAVNNSSTHSNYKDQNGTSGSDTGVNYGIRIVGDNSHGFWVNNEGTNDIQFCANTPSASSGHIMFPATVEGEAVVKVRYIEPEPQTISNTNPTGVVSTKWWNTEGGQVKQVEWNELKNAKAGDKLIIMAAPEKNVWHDGNELTSPNLYIKGKNSHHELEFPVYDADGKNVGYNSETNWNSYCYWDVPITADCAEKAYAFVLTAEMLAEIEKYNGITITGVAIKIGDVKVQYLNNGTDGVKRVSVTAGATPAVDLMNVPNGGEITFRVYGNDANRNIYVGATSGTEIEYIKWTPQSFNLSVADLKCVNDVTTWRKDNKFGYFPYTSGTAYPVTKEMLNNGGGDVPASTLMVFNSDEFTRTSNLLIAGTATPTAYTAAIKVKGPGVLKVVVAQTGPSGRAFDVYVNHQNSDGSYPTPIFDAAHSIMRTAAHVGGGVQEHVPDLRMSQHSSYHTYYMKYGAEEGARAVGEYRGGVLDGDVLYIYSTSTSIQEIKWLPDVELPEMCPENSLWISEVKDADGTVIETASSNNGGSLSSYSLGGVLRHQTLEENPFMAQYSHSDDEHLAKTIVINPLLNEKLKTIQMSAQVNAPLVANEERKAPVWTSSTDGLGSPFNEIFTNDHAGSALWENHDKRAASISTTLDDWFYTNDRNHKGGIFYIVAGTEEGNRTDWRRLEIAGAPSAVRVYDMENKEVTHITISKGTSIQVKANPVLYMRDWEMDRHSGRTKQIMVDDPETMWTGNNNYAQVTSGGNNDQNLTQEFWQQQYELITIYGNEKGTTTFTVSTYNGKTTELVVDVIDPYEIDLKRLEPEDMKNVPVDADLVYRAVVGSEVTEEDVENLYIRITTPKKPWQPGFVLQPEIVSYDKESRTYILKYNIVEALKTIPGAGDHMIYDEEHYIEFPKPKYNGDTDTKTYDVNHHDWIISYDKTEKPNGEREYTYNTASIPAENETTSITVSTSQIKGYNKNIDNYLKNGDDFVVGKWGNYTLSADQGTYTQPGGASRHDEPLHIVPDPADIRLETFIYNVLQRTKTDLEGDINAGRILNENTSKNGTATWWCNHRSKISFNGLTAGGEIKNGNNVVNYNYLKTDATNGAVITIEPYDNQMTGVEESIESIEINFNNENGKAKTAIATFDFESEGTAYSMPENANNDYKSVIWRPNMKNIHSISIAITEDVYIDQIKINYYAINVKESSATMTFADCTHDGKNGTTSLNDLLANGKSVDVLSKYTVLERVDGNLQNVEKTAVSTVKLTFGQDNIRHFNLRCDYKREESGYNVGEVTSAKTLDDGGAKNVLVIRDDKTNPCKFFIEETNHKATISSIEFVLEKNVRNSDKRNEYVRLFCTSDPRHNDDDNGDYRDYNMVGYNLTPLYGLEEGQTDYQQDASDTYQLYKLIYRPESPVNYAAFTADCNETGFLFVRAIIVRCSDNASETVYQLDSPNGNDVITDITSIPLQTDGIKFTTPSTYPTKTIDDMGVQENEAEIYTIKRTSLRNNQSREVNQTATTSGTTVTLNDDDDNSNSHFLHNKNYTVRVINKNRIVIRQLSFHTASNKMPEIAYTLDNGATWKQNSNLHADDPFRTKTFSVQLRVENSEETLDEEGITKYLHPADNKIIIYTVNGDAPQVIFDENGNVKEFIGTAITPNTEIWDNGKQHRAYNLPSSEIADITASTQSASVVIKAIALPLKGKAPASPSVDNVNRVGTFGEPSEINRANYTYIDDNTYYTTARRNESTGALLTDLDANAYTQSYDITSSNASGFLPDHDENNQPISTDDKFFAGYAPLDNNGNIDMLTYGGYELWKATGDDTGDFQHTVITNDYWMVKANDLTPYRGIRTAVAGDAYIVSAMQPMNENGKWLGSNGIAIGQAGYSNGKMMPDGHTDGSDDEHTTSVWKGEFDFNSFRTIDADRAYTKLWSLPCYGDYFTYEPEADGMLTVYVKQEGVLDQDNGSLDDMLAWHRPVFILDERGDTPENIKATTSSKVSGDAMTTFHSLRSNKPTVTNRYLTADQSRKLLNMCKTWVDDNTADDDGNIEYGDRAYHEQGVIALYGSIENARKATGVREDKTAFSYTNIEGEYDDNTRKGRPAFLGERGSGNANGFMIVSEGYVKYEFPVKAGKTYFVFAQNGNLGMCSYSFVKGANADNDAAITMPINDASANLGDWIDDNAGTPKNVHINRTFKANQWSSLIVPFSVSKHQLRRIFGDGVRISHFDHITDKALMLRRHVHQMVVAGVPVFIMPSKNVSSDEVVFHNVTIETAAKTPATVYHTDSEGHAYCSEGAYNYGIHIHNGYYYTNSAGKFAERGKGDAYFNGSQCWIRPLTQGRMVHVREFGFGGFWAGEDGGNDKGEATGIDITEMEAQGKSNGGNNVYDAVGRIVRVGTDLQGLPAGVYIVNGEKQVIK